MKHERVNIRFHPGFEVPKSWKLTNELEDEADIPQIGVKSYRVPPGQAKKICDKLHGHVFVKDIEVDGEGEGIPFDGAAASTDWDSLLNGDEWFQVKTRSKEAWAELAKIGWRSPKVGVCDCGLKQDQPWVLDQCTVGGQKNFVANETTVADNEGHGTACAGLVCSEAPYFTLYNARVMSQNSAKWSAVSQGIIWCVDQGCVVVSVSIGGPTNSFTLIDALLYAYNKGVAVVVAAGNSGNETPQYPAATKNAVAISATDENDNKCGFSNYGSHIQLAAPGQNLLTAWGDGFARFSGTSGSTPIAAGVVAMTAERWRITGLAAVAKVKETARNLGNALYFGAGRVDAAAAVGLPAGSEPPPAPPPQPPPPMPTNDQNPPSKTSQPTITEKTSTGFRATWVAATDNVGVVKHRLYLDTVAVQDVDMPGVTWLFTGLTPGRTYIIQVRGVDAAGNQGPHSDPLHVSLPASSTPPPPPPPPETPELLLSTLTALVVIEEDRPSYTRTIDRGEVIAKLNRLIGIYSI